MSLKKFSTMDLVVITMMAALGIAIKPVVTPLAQIITGPLLIPGGTVAGGFYMLWLVLGYGLTGNKPGTALLIGLVQGIIVILQPFANHGAFSVISYAAPGLAVELVYLFLKGPRNPASAFAGGVAANITGSFLVTTVVMRVVIWRLPAVPFLLMLLTAVLSGGIGGLVAYGLLTRLKNFAPLGGSSMKNKWLLALVIVLAVAVGLLAWLNGRRVRDLDPASLTIKVQGEEVGSISIEEISALGGEEFSKSLRSSGKKPRENTYTGVLLSKVLEAVKPGLVSKDVQISVLASDGYAVSYSGADVLRPEHIYLVWLMDGKPLASKAKGGLGPLLVLTRQDEFGQTWCKYAIEVDIR